MDKKTKQSFVWLGIFSIFAWFLAIFSLIALFFMNGRVPSWNTPTVPLLVYKDVVAWNDVLIFDVIPGLTCGYLLIGLFIFKWIDRLKREQD